MISSEEVKEQKPINDLQGRRTAETEDVECCQIVLKKNNSKRGMMNSEEDNRNPAMMNSEEEDNDELQ